MILEKAKQEALSFEDETEDTMAIFTLTSKDLLKLIEYAKGNIK